MGNSIETKLIFQDQRKQVVENLDEFVPLGIGDEVRIEKDLGGQSVNNMGNAVNRDTVRKGRYLVAGIKRLYSSVEGLFSSEKFIFEYTLKRFSEE